MTNQEGNVVRCGDVIEDGMQSVATQWQQLT